MARYRYVRIDETHPLAVQIGMKNHVIVRSPRIGEHRLVLWDKIGPGEHPCHWCGTHLQWGKGVRHGVLIADHLDGDPSNNDPENIVASCNVCNSIRVRRGRPRIEPGEATTTAKDGTRLRAKHHPCQWCGDTFTAELSRPNPRFCSQSCTGKWSADRRWHPERYEAT